MPVCRATGLSALGDLVANVLRVGSQKEMIGSHALAIVAVMAHGKPVRYLAEVHLPGEPMRQAPWLAPMCPISIGGYAADPLPKLGPRANEGPEVFRGKAAVNLPR